MSDLNDREAAQRQETAFLFDMDGTLVDSVYQHVLAWREALEAEGIDLSVWRIHRKIGMSGGLFTNMLLRETSVEIDYQRLERLQRLQPTRTSEMQRIFDRFRVPARCSARRRTQRFPGPSRRVGALETAAPLLELLGVDPSRTPVVTRGSGEVRANPSPICF